MVSTYKNERSIKSDELCKLLSQTNIRTIENSLSTKLIIQEEKKIKKKKKKKRKLLINN